MRYTGLYLKKTSTIGTRPENVPKTLSARGYIADSTQYGYIKNKENFHVFEQLGWVKATKGEVDKNIGSQYSFIKRTEALSSYLSRFPMD